MDIKELKQQTSKKLNEILSSDREKLRDLRFRVASKQVKNIREIREVKKNISRILTLLHKK
jgi:ribosomal protein L29